DAAQVGLGELRLLDPAVAAVLGLDDVPVAVDGPADLVVEEPDIVGARAGDRRLGLAPPERRGIACHVSPLWVFQAPMWWPQMPARAERARAAGPSSAPA